MKRRFSIDQFWSRFLVLTGGRALGAMATFLSSLVIARHWGGNSLGTLAIYLSALSVMSVIVSGGFPSVGVLFSPEYRAKDQFPLLKGLILWARKYMLGSSALCGIGVFAYLLVFGNDQNAVTSASIALIFTLAVFATATLNLHGAVFIGLERQFAGLLPEALLKPLSFLLIVGAAAATQLSLGPGHLFLAFMVGLVLASSVSYLITQQTAQMRQIVTPKHEVSRWKSAALPWVMTTLASDLFIEFHILLTGYMAAASEVAVLHIAFRFRVLAAFGMRSIYMLFLPKIIAANASKNTPDVQSNLVKMNALSLGYAVGVLGLFLIAGPFMMGLFGPEFRDGSVLLIVVSLSIVARALFGPASSILAMHGHHGVTAKVTLTMLAASLLASAVLFPVYGSLGVAVSYSTSNFMAGLILWWLAKKKTQLDCSLFSAVGRQPTLKP